VLLIEEEEISWEAIQAASKHLKSQRAALGTTPSAGPTIEREYLRRIGIPSALNEAMKIGFPFSSGGVPGRAIREPIHSF